MDNQARLLTLILYEVLWLILISLIMKYPILLFFLLIVSCSTTKVHNQNISVSRYKSSEKYSFPSLVIKCYDFDYNNKRRSIPATVDVNGIVFNSKTENDSIIKKTVIRPLPDSNLDIKISFIGKKEVLLNNFKLKPKDSIVFDVYMMDSNEVLY